MSDAPPDARPPAPEARPPRRKRPAFLWTVGACVGSTAALTAAAALIPIPDMGGLWFLIAMPVVWISAFFLGVAVWANDGHTTEGAGGDIMLGALAGAVVGFSLCSGVFWTGGAI